MNIFKAAFFAGMLLASQTTAQTFGRFHSGVNLSVAAGGSDRSAAPLDMLGRDWARSQHRFDG
jgi:hypothetical protein